MTEFGLVELSPDDRSQITEKFIGCVKQLGEVPETDSLRTDNDTISFSRDLTNTHPDFWGVTMEFPNTPEVTALDGKSDIIDECVEVIFRYWPDEDDLDKDPVEFPFIKDGGERWKLDKEGLKISDLRLLDTILSMMSKV